MAHRDEPGLRSILKALLVLCLVVVALATFCALLYNLWAVAWGLVGLMFVSLLG